MLQKRYLKIQKAEDLKRRVCKKYEKYEVLSYVIEHRAYATSE